MQMLSFIPLGLLLTKCARMFLLLPHRPTSDTSCFYLPSLFLLLVGYINSKVFSSSTSLVFSNAHPAVIFFFHLTKFTILSMTFFTMLLSFLSFSRNFIPLHIFFSFNFYVVCVYTSYKHHVILSHMRGINATHQRTGRGSKI